MGWSRVVVYEEGGCRWMWIDVGIVEDSTLLKQESERRKNAG
jgi:hypothetical protein